MTFRKSLWIALTLLAIVPVFILGVLSSAVAVNNANEAAKRQLLNIAKGSGISFENYLLGQDREVRLMANTRRLGQCLVQAAKGDWENGIFPESDHALSNWVDADESYARAFLTDEKGKLLSCSTDKEWKVDLTTQSWFVEAMSTDNVYNSDVVASIFEPEKEVIYMTCKVKWGGYTGFLTLETSLGFYENIVKQMHTNEAGNALIVDENNTMICNTDPNSVLYDTEKVKVLLEQYQAGTTAQYGTDIYKVDGQRRMMGYYILDKAGWVFITNQLLSEIEQPAYVAFYSMLVLVVIGVLIVIFVCQYLIRSFMDPIQKLQKVFQMAAEENNYIVCELEGENEFTELAGGYNIMIQRLNKSFEELDALYEEVIANEDELRKNYVLLKEEQEKTEQLALYDSLTGLANRTSFERRLQVLIEEGASAGVLFLDLDGFKTVNDVFGHPIGDLCLVELAKRLSYLELGVDLVSRIGGDEFFIIKKGNKEEIESLAVEINKVIENSFEIEGLRLHLTGSIGISMIPEDGKDMVNVIKNADIAMYQAKERGNNQYCFSNAGMVKKLERQMTLLQTLNNAIKNKELFALYQPEIHVESGKVIALETLMRLDSKEHGFVSPAEFIPIAESSRKIIPIGEWILEEACRFAKNMLAQGLEFEFISVNVSVVQLENINFVDTVMDVLDRVGLSPQYLQIEITESILMANAKSNIKKLNALHEKGISIAMDDFGTGFSSMSYLIELPIDILKIDKSFIDEITTNHQKQTICQTIIEMAHALGLKVVAEGVELKEQRELLAEMKCDIIQGYYYSRPLNEADALDFISHSNSPESE